MESDFFGTRVILFWGLLYQKRFINELGINTLVLSPVICKAIEVFLTSLLLVFLVLLGGLMKYGLLLVLFSIIAFCSTVFAAPWDFLRAPAGAFWYVEPIVLWVLFFAALIVFVIAIKAVSKKHSNKLKLVAAAFGLLLLKAILLLLDMYVSPGNFFNYSIQSFFDLLIILCLFAALFRK